MPTENLREMRRRDIADGRGDEGDRQLRARQQLLCGFAAYAVVVFQQRSAGGFLEGAQQIGFVHMQGLGQRREGEFFRIVRPNVLLRGSRELLFWPIPALKLRVAAAAGRVSLRQGLVQRVKEDDPFRIVAFLAAGGAADLFGTSDGVEKASVVCCVAVFDGKPLFSGRRRSLPCCKLVRLN